MIKWLLKLPIHAWRLLIAPILPPSCRFYPSCSHYALQAIDTLPLWRALPLILWRLVRCQPFHPGGYDPVPGTDGPCDHHSHEPHPAPEPSTSKACH